ncbi:MAG TPA: PTS sugar transporter subunit IIA [Spirochaetales bacterium]|nr:PTS sugar transporter subunit IIA [Spirochaetales bacterium]HOV38557.1 PTS sugar transporter subunit IIA [Spirochaetales bacterium]
MDIADYLSSDCIVFSHNAADKSSILESLIEAAYQAGKIRNKHQFAEAIATRELIVSTGIGLGVAVPHAKLKTLDQFFIALGILRKGVEWESIDGEPVRLVFLVGGPDDKQNEYLNILAYIVKTVKNSTLRENLLKSEKPEEALELLKG